VPNYITDGRNLVRTIITLSPVELLAVIVLLITISTILGEVSYWGNEKRYYRIRDKMNVKDG